jgi:chemotaxis protein CheX
VRTTAITEETLAQIVESVCRAVLGLPIEPLATPALTDATPDLSACVHITGAWNGAVLFWPTDRFAVQTAATLLAIPESEVAVADVHDSMAELCNIIAGNLKSVLPGPSALSLPTVTRGINHEVFVRRTRSLARLAFFCASEPLSVQLLEGVVSAPCECQGAIRTTGASTPDCEAHEWNHALDNS